MSDRLDRLEKIVESNSKAIEAWANESVQIKRDAEAREQHMVAAIERTNAIITELANVVYAVTNRQDDHENRINRLEDRL